MSVLDFRSKRKMIKQTTTLFAGHIFYTAVDADDSHLRCDTVVSTCTNESKKSVGRVRLWSRRRRVLRLGSEWCPFCNYYSDWSRLQLVIETKWCENLWTFSPGSDFSDDNYFTPWISLITTTSVPWHLHGPDFFWFSVSFVPSYRSSIFFNFTKCNYPRFISLAFTFVCNKY